ncbi:hypothetical protein KY330_05190 [Candidatus Woesearchaeota archaeon]|nr:hypothetical protein [Candidatus Woesearchaeota archaeon]
MKIDQSIADLEHKIRQAGSWRERELGALQLGELRKFKYMITGDLRQAELAKNCYRAAELFHYKG